MSFSGDQISSVLRKSALEIFQVGVAAADPYQAVKRCLKADNNQLHIALNDCGGRRIGQWTKIHLIAFGKAACPMIKAALAVIPAHLLGQALAVTNYENVSHVKGAKVIGAGHPLPDNAGFRAAKQCADIAENAQVGELVLVLVSGGGSALIPYPVDSITLTDKIGVTQLLLESGATINQINCVRKHLSQLKGGGLARMIAPADYHTLILSDVLGDDLSAIASGPTVPDETTFADAIEVLQRKNILDKAPESICRYLEQGRLGNAEETPKPQSECFKRGSHSLIGSNKISVNAIFESASSRGFTTLTYSDKLCGEAQQAAKNLACFAKNTKHVAKTPIAIVAGGETTVTIKGNGRGGRNQEMALAFAIHAEQQGLSGSWVFLSGGTDGRDGPTDAAGGVVDNATIRRLVEAGVNPSDKLANNDSYAALKSSQDLLITGATGTNVADLQILLIQP